MKRGREGDGEAEQHGGSNPPRHLPQVRLGSEYFDVIFYRATLLTHT